MTLSIPDDIAPSILAATSKAGLSVNAYVVRAATLDAAKQLATLGLGDGLADEGDAL
ncbi:MULTISPECIES: toxin-antitoxin system HicB family antitoxin [unclassified Streptomyces]|uniref:toxin-antitoxin system HicB family antitoxin n=1 Tax=unclassified Streptomyces TaxID=2593676 RepID=UPI001F1D0EB6|nr:MULTISPECIES: toxin-antitoxin system HicB family antitoxin [unclassified Streptomyces]WKX23253.1 toxin-antitoxin system HicB family antitoxin [Streptomyces sp. HUAS CX7]